MNKTTIDRYRQIAESSGKTNVSFKTTDKKRTFTYTCSEGRHRVTSNLSRDSELLQKCPECFAEQEHQGKLDRKARVIKILDELEYKYVGDEDLADLTNTAPIKVRCNHGHDFTTNMSEIILGKACPTCRGVWLVYMYQSQQYRLTFTDRNLSSLTHFGVSTIFTLPINPNIDRFEFMLLLKSRFSKSRVLMKGSYLTSGKNFYEHVKPQILAAQSPANFRKSKPIIEQLINPPNQ